MRRLYIFDRHCSFLAKLNKIEQINIYKAQIKIKLCNIIQIQLDTFKELNFIFVAVSPKPFIFFYTTNQNKIQMLFLMVAWIDGYSPYISTYY